MALRPTVDNDDDKKRYAPGQKVSGPFGAAPLTRVKEYNPNENPLTYLNSMIRNPIQQGLNFLGEFHGGARDKVGTGAGDLLFGSVPQGYYNQRNQGRSQQFPNSPSFGQSTASPAVLSDEWRAQQSWNQNRGAQQAPPQDPADFADYLARAIEMLGNGGAGGGVNYDPQRETLRGNAAENDARLEAMYRQLRGSIDADAPVLRDAYDEALASTRQNTTDAQAQTQAATDAANSRNNEVLANLGIQEAQRNQIQEGRDLNSQTAQQIADRAMKGQAAGDRLVSNQATALAHNTNIGNAAGLEGNLQRAANQARLQALLADIDMQEQQQNASAQSNNFGQQLALAQELLGFDRYNQERQDQQEMSVADMMNSRYLAELEAQGEQLPDFDAMLQGLASRGIGIPEDPRDLSELLNVARRFSFG